MTTLTIPLVRSWRPETLDVAAGDLGAASRSVDAQVAQLRSALEHALEDAAGRWADQAAERAAEETRTGARLAAALDDARAALSAGAADIAHTRRLLLDRIDLARGEGFVVADDGSVTAPALPPVMSTPEDAARVAAEREEEQRRLGDVEVPQTLESAVDAYIERALASGDLLASLGKAGAGGAALALTLKNAFRLFGKSSALASFLKASSAPITDYGTFLRNLGAADDALGVFVKGQADGGFARFLMGSRAARIAGKAFLPLTALTGAIDGVTGGGHDGARGWATRGFGLAGAAGAGTLMASSAGLVALGPVGLGIAGVAVLGYGAWTTGSYVYDHWDDITEFGQSAVDWAGDRWSDTTDALDSATQWAGDRLEDAGDSLLDAGRSTVSTLSLGLLG